MFLNDGIIQCVHIYDCIYTVCVCVCVCVHAEHTIPPPVCLLQDVLHLAN